MRCPFPGMDPYIEREDRWPDFHLSMTVAMSGLLQPHLKPDYVSVVAQRPTVRFVSDDAADEEWWRFVTIVSPRAPRQPVTVINVSTPDEKEPGPGREVYAACRGAWIRSGANVIDVDLLRGGELPVGLRREEGSRLTRRAAKNGTSHYWVVLQRATSPDRQEVWPLSVRERLPSIPVPLAPGASDVTVDLQEAFGRCWDGGPYPELLHYDERPLGPMSDEDVAWCVNLLRKKQMR
jgi:hypothetical protein